MSKNEVTGFYYGVLDVENDSTFLGHLRLWAYQQALTNGIKSYLYSTDQSSNIYSVLKGIEAFLLGASVPQEETGVLDDLVLRYKDSECLPVKSIVDDISALTSGWHHLYDKSTEFAHAMVLSDGSAYGGYKRDDGTWCITVGVSPYITYCKLDIDGEGDLGQCTIESDTSYPAHCPPPDMWNGWELIDDVLNNKRTFKEVQ